uniref:Protein kinase domain-containing protein n=1 Tax=Oryzias melastigma TaxID=30732 RepID=A0A3B3BED6_ORYME
MATSVTLTLYLPRKTLIIMSDGEFEVRENSLLLGYNGLYQVEKFLGEGTFGKVAKCREVATNQEVAIKILKSKYKDAGRDEIQCIDWFRYKSHICIAFEILDKSLDDFMSDRDDRPLDLHEIRTIAWQLLIALQGLKNINLVHGDIKLDNIMLVNQVSEPFRVKLIDFGLAQKTSHIQTGSRMQNLLFRAPEVMLGLPLDERLDMWTVGYVLAMLYAGIYIHPQDSEYNIIRALVKIGERVEEHLDYFSFDDLRDVYYDMTKRDEVEQFIDLLKRMLEVDPNKRISPSEAFEHPFFTMKSVQPSAGSEEPKPEDCFKQQEFIVNQLTVEEFEARVKKPGFVPTESFQLLGCLSSGVNFLTSIEGF